MSTDVVRCDRCKKVTLDVREYPHDYHDWGRILMNQINGPFSISEGFNTPLDVCEYCVASLKDWWDRGAKPKAEQIAEYVASLAAADKIEKASISKAMLSDALATEMWRVLHMFVKDKHALSMLTGAVDALKTRDEDYMDAQYGFLEEMK